MVKKLKKENANGVIKQKNKRGRPKKVSNANIVKQEQRPKLTLKEKQELKLQVQKQREQAKAGVEPANKERFYCKNKDLIAELEKWRDSAEKPEDRIISEELGRMIIAVGEKMLNRSEFRIYSKELKEDMVSMFYLKLIKGLKNYNFKFNNPFAFFSTAAWNAFLTIISKHYKQQNIKKNLMEKLAQELQTYTGINPTSGLSKVIKSYIGNDIDANN